MGCRADVASKLLLRKTGPFTIIQRIGKNAYEIDIPNSRSKVDIIDFFTKNMVNEMLGTICNAHVVHADQSAYGAMDETCLQLAELAALAVDFPKTGKIVTMPHSLKPKMYPDFMDKGDSQSYKSKKILGRLYRKIRDASDGDILSPSELSLASENIAFDDIFKIEGSDIFISDAWNQKCSYDRQLNALLSHYNIKSEEELVTGHLWSMPKCSSRKQGELKEKLKHAYLSLKKEFRDAFVCVGEGNEQLTEEERNTLYEQKASAWYQVTYHPQWIKESVAMIDPDGGKGAPVRLSFAWIPAEYLVRIKIKSRVTNL
ncbi:hypothetical protein GIB67_036056 [Kingdonia uniflora]|uniref:RNA-dependent RNA polymerase n=1 Tax=Kingdonia uniflora TaxID=39325 RepID=A0A7J7NEH4_9MAGN|nr:hypothetical protein GIB67_036056 [Kingdonia uniflora]